MKPRRQGGVTEDVAGRPSRKSETNFHIKMEHLGLHAAAHVFFENKLDDLTSEFNGKMKKMQAFVQKELRKLHDIHMGEVKKLKQEVRGESTPKKESKLHSK